MQNIYFDFNGKTYSGYVLKDPNPAENYLWFIFNEKEIIEAFGDSIAFRVENDKVKPMYLYTRQAGFIEQLRQKVEAAVLTDQ